MWLHLFFFHHRAAYRQVTVAEHLDTTANISGWFNHEHWLTIKHIDGLAPFHRFEISMDVDPSLKNKADNEVITY